MEADSTTTANVHDTAYEDGLEWRIAFADGKLTFIRATADQNVDDFRTFAYDKVAPYCTAISRAFAHCVEGEFVELHVHHTTTMDNFNWRQTCWWVMNNGYRPLLDEPFRELLTLIEKVHDATIQTTTDKNAETPTDTPADTPANMTTRKTVDTVENIANGNLLHIPLNSGITSDVTIFKIARLYWSAKHLHLQKPMSWTDDLRTNLLRSIQAIDVTGSEGAAFRGVDFWYIWGAFRGLDEAIVDAMVAKLVDAIDRSCQPWELDHLVTEVDELEGRMEAHKVKKGKMTWAQSLGGGISSRREAPAPLKLTEKTDEPSWRVPKSTSSVIKSQTPGTDDDVAPKTSDALVTILKKERSDSVTSQKMGEFRDDDNNKKSKGGAFTAPSGMAPPPSAKGNGRGQNKNKKNGSWGGSKRGKGKGGGAGGGAGAGDSWR